MRQCCRLLIAAALLAVVGGGAGVVEAQAAKSAYTPHLGTSSSNLEQVCINSQYRSVGVSKYDVRIRGADKKQTMGTRFWQFQTSIFTSKE